MVKFISCIYHRGGDSVHTFKQVHHFVDVLYSVHFHVIDNSRFPGILLRHYQTFVTFFSGLYGHGQCTFDGAYFSIQTQLTHDDVIFKRIAVLQLFCSTQQTNGHGQIESGATLADIGRCHIYHHTGAGHFVPVAFNGAFHPLHAFFYGIVGQAHND